MVCKSDGFICVDASSSTVVLACLRIPATGHQNPPHTLIHLLCRESSTLAHWSLPSQVLKQGHRDSNQMETLAVYNKVSLAAHHTHCVDICEVYKLSSEDKILVGLLIWRISFEICQTVKLRTLTNFRQVTIQYTLIVEPHDLNHKSLLFALYILYPKAETVHVQLGLLTSFLNLLR